jgi:glyoxylase-like metal-dependent hydrolase (beta-lactamase superfamily II)
VVRPKTGERGVRRYLADDWREEALPVHAFLVEHPNGLCLFDAGQTAAAAQPGHFPWWHPFFRLSRFELTQADELVRQLRQIGVEPARLRWIVLSHLHTDHVGGLDTLPHGEVIVSQTEWQRASGLAGRLRGYVPQHWPVAHIPLTVAFDGPPVGPFEGSYDVAGDERLLLVPTPGHTPGHASLLVRGGEVTWLLGGDLAHDRGELDATAPDIAAFCRDERVRFLAAHDPDAPALVGD